LKFSFLGVPRRVFFLLLGRRRPPLDLSIHSLWKNWTLFSFLFVLDITISAVLLLFGLAVIHTIPLPLANRSVAYSGFLNLFPPFFFFEYVPPFGVPVLSPFFQCGCGCPPFCPVQSFCPSFLSSPVRITPSRTVSRFASFLCSCQFCLHFLKIRSAATSSGLVIRFPHPSRP